MGMTMEDMLKRTNANMGSNTSGLGFSLGLRVEGSGFSFLRVQGLGLFKCFGA